jgi:membrane protein YqaA with SNARE-associated domain
VEALISLGGKPHSIHAGWFLISVANLVVIVLMIVAFLLALFLPFPRERDDE